MIFPFLSARVIKKTSAPDGGRAIRFLQVSQDFMVEGVLKFSQRLCCGVCVRILFLQIGEHFRIGLFTEPKVVVYSLVSVSFDYLWHLCSNRRRRRSGIQVHNLKKTHKQASCKQSALEHRREYCHAPRECRAE